MTTHAAKVVVVGDSGVGKSTIVNRYVCGNFAELEPTIGIDFKVKHVPVGGEGADKLKLTFWDTAGQERFRALGSAHYRRADAVIFVYDVSRPESFASIASWIREADLYLADSVVKMIIGNKIDTRRAVTRDEAMEFARYTGALYFEVSAKTYEGISIAFDELCLKIHEHAQPPPLDTVSVTGTIAVDGCCY